MYVPFKLVNTLTHRNFPFLLVLPSVYKGAVDARDHIPYSPAECVGRQDHHHDQRRRRGESTVCTKVKSTMNGLVECGK